MIQYLFNKVKSDLETNYRHMTGEPIIVADWPNFKVYIAYAGYEVDADIRYFEVAAFKIDHTLFVVYKNKLSLLYKYYFTKFKHTFHHSTHPELFI